MGEEKMPWTVELEVNLFHAMRKHKPVGVNRHFQMAIIQEKLNASSPKQKIPSKQIWKHLETMYDLAALNESEISSFPKKENEFQLAGGDYEEIKTGDFPRVMGDHPSAAGPSSDPSVKQEKDGEREGSHHRERAHKGGKAPRGTTDPDRGSDSPRVEESPKREPRKRTRHNLSSPATSENTPKRPRRN